MEAHYVISKRIVDECRKLDDQWKNIPIQATGKTKDKLKLLLKPGRDSDVIIMLPAGTKVDILGRTRTVRRIDSDSVEKMTGKTSEPVNLDTWFIVRIGGESLIMA